MTFRDDNGNELQIDTRIAMTKQAVSFFNGSIKGDVSTTFQVDNNSVNREVLGYSGPQMVNQIAWTKQAFNRMRNGNILDRGYIVIQDDDEDFLSCFYVSGNSNWVQLLNGLITDLDYSGITNGKDYNQILTVANMQALVSATDGVIFPMVDFCYDNRLGSNNYFGSTNDVTRDVTNQPLLEFYPALYLKSLTEEILNQNGLKISGNVLDDQIYKSMILPSCKGKMMRDSFSDIIVSGSLTVGVLATTQITNFTEILDPDGLFSNNSLTTPKKAKIIVTITVTSKSTSGLIQLVAYKNGVFYANLSEFETIGTFHTNDITLNSIGDVYTFYLTNTTGVPDTSAFRIRFETAKTIGYDDYIEPSIFLPSLKSLDVVKFIVNYFGCAVTFNEYSKTITCNIIEKIKTEDAYDWSEYFVSSKASYTVNQAQNNYLKWTKNDSEILIKNYDSKHDLNFADGNIVTDNTLKKDNDLYKFPFAPTAAELSINGFFLSNIPLINLTISGDAIPFTAIADLGSGNCAFTIPSGAMDGTNDEVISITNSDGVSLGYFSTLSGSLTTLNVKFPFYGTDTGFIYKQQINYQEVQPRILTVKPSTNVSDFSNSSITGFTTIPYATFTKPIILDGIDQWKNNLAIDNPDSGGFTDPTIKELYFNKISRFLNNPNIKARFILPESVYQSFTFDQFIYLKTERLTGYFFVDSIVNYVDGTTPVEVNLYML